MAKRGTLQGAARAYFESVVLPYEGDECTAWPFSESSGRGQVYYKGKLRKVHRLLCELEHGPPPTPKHEAAHSCGKEWCVTKRHQSWKTHAENAADMIRHGTSTRGERHAHTSLTNELVREIRALRGELSQSKIAARFGVARSTISNIHLGTRWGWLDEADRRPQ